MLWAITTENRPFQAAEHEHEALANYSVRERGTIAPANEMITDPQNLDST